MSLDWIKPFMTKRAVAAGEIPFRKGDVASQMYFVVDGELHAQKIDIAIRAGAFVGALAGQIGAGNFLRWIGELYYQNPRFGFYFLRLSTARLFENIGRLMGALGERGRKVLALRNASSRARGRNMELQKPWHPGSAAVQGNKFAQT